MPFIGVENKEIVFKIVYYGPGMSGKTTNLIHVHRTLAQRFRGDMIVLDTAEERTLFFDFFPMELGRIGGYAVRFFLYTVPGQVYYEASRRVILEGADGVVFVADSRPQRLEDNIDCMSRMLGHLRDHEVAVEKFPVTVQYNRRDCPAPIRLGAVETRVGLRPVSVFEAVATTGVGVMETIRAMSREVVSRFEI
jgi:mutual gliding-motility protein MglA